MMHNSGVPGMAYYSYSAQNSPAIETANEEFSFPTVTLPPRLKNIGRKISQMSNDFLPPTDEDTKPLSLSPSSTKKEIVEVPGMGDEPVMCPFCDKPLPPSLLAAHLTAGKGTHATAQNQSNKQPQNALKRTPSTRQGTPTPSAPLSRVPSSTAATPGSQSLKYEPPHPKALLDALPVTTPEIEPALPSATSESFAATVKEGDIANHTAAEKFITDEEIKRWSSLSGLSLPSLKDKGKEDKNKPVAVKQEPKAEKAFPLIPPPPGPAKLTKPPPSQAPSHSRPSSSGSAPSSPFKLFGRKSNKGGKNGDDDDESDDDNVASAGYAKLTAPGSPTDSEDDEGLKLKINKNKKRLSQQDKGDRTAQPADVKAQLEEPKPDSAVTEKSGSAMAGESVSAPSAVSADGAAVKVEGKDDDVRKIVQEVLSRVNEMTQSHNALLASHSTLLTSLKIARSNLAMAEANSEMLEGQLKRASATPKSVPSSVRGPTPRNISSPASASSLTPAPASIASTQSLAPRSSADHARAATTTNAVGSPANTSRTPARASMEERTRPASLMVTANDLASAGSITSPASATDSGHSWGFWNGSKKRVSGVLGQMNVTIPQSRPGTPGGDRTSSEFPWSVTSPVAQSSVLRDAEAPRPIVRPAPVPHSSISRSLNTQSGLARSMSTTHVPSQRSTSSGPPPVTSKELATLRQAYSSAVAKMDGMSKELAELKKGKIEMEAELENLSQALFEEANKMVSDERRKRAEIEENLKEVREEREALRQTIKVLGGKVEEDDGQGLEIKGGDEEAQAKGDEVGPSSFSPRDLDKHYEALSKAIHHVASGADLAEQEEPNTIASSLPIIAEPISVRQYPGDAMGVGLEIPSRSTTIDSTTSDPGAHHGISVSLPAESNPWASSSPPRISVKAATPSPHPELGDLVEDKAGEGELPTGAADAMGLGLDMDLEEGVVGTEGKKGEATGSGPGSALG